jgi:hypothetical protein
MAKVITLLQPWAQLVVTTDKNGVAFKEFETRSFQTHYRGELFIHSSARMHAGDFELCQEDPDFKACIPDVSQLKLGFIIGKVTLVKCIPTNNSEAMAYITHKRGGIAARREFRFGDYRNNRYAWELKDPILFANPIFARGQLQVWNYNHPDINDLIPAPTSADPGDGAPMMGQSY